MALNYLKLKADMKAAHQAAQTMQNKDDASDYLAEQIAIAISEFVKSGEVVFSPGEITGVAPGGGGPITAGAGTGGEII